MSHSFTRRQLMPTFAGFAAAAAINPFPRVFPTRVQESTPASLPEPAESQALRIVQGPLSGLYDITWFFDASVWLTPFIQNEDGMFSPGVCSDYTVSDDLLTYTLKMNPDAVWSDGSKITAHDIKYTWEWEANPAHEQTGRIPYGPSTKVVGLADVMAGTVTEANGLVVLDDDTLTVTLTEPYTPFIYQCSETYAHVLPKATLEAGGVDWDKQLPVLASGPFVPESLDINAGSASFAPNPRWWGKKPTLERIEFVPISDAGTQLLSWQNDECEVLNIAYAPSAFYQQYGASEIIQIYRSVHFVSMKTTVPPFDDLHFRRAVQRSIDVQTITSLLWGADKQPATSISDPLDAAYEERPFLFDVDAAKAELAQSKYANNPIPSVTWVVPYGVDGVTQGTAIQQMLKDTLAFDVQVIPGDQATAEQTNESALQLTGNGLLYAGAGGLLTWAWHQDNARMGFVAADDDEFEALLVRGDSLPVDDVAGRADAYRQADQLMLDRGYVIPVWYVENDLPIKKRVVGAKINPAWTLNTTEIYIAKTE